MRPVLPVPAPVLREWATEQAKLVASTKMPRDHKLEAASLVMLCGGNVSDLPVAIRDGEYLTASALESLLQELGEVEMYEGSEIEYDEDDDVRPKAFKNEFSVSATLFLVPHRAHSILTVGEQSWPECVPELYSESQERCCEDAFHGALRRAWGVEPEWDEDSRVVGETW